VIEVPACGRQAAENRKCYGEIQKETSRRS